MRLFHSKPIVFQPSELLSFPVRFWGWSENEREAALDLAELQARAQQNLPLYGESDQPEWVQQAAYSNSVWSQLKFREIVRLTPKKVYLFSHDAYRGFPNVRSCPISPWGFITDRYPRFNLVNHQHHGTDTSQYKK